MANPPLDIFGNLAWLNKWVKNLLGRVRNLELNPGGGVPTLPATQIAFGDVDDKLTSSTELTWEDGILNVVGEFKLADDTQGLDKVLTSDNNGLASWQEPKDTRPYKVFSALVTQNYDGGTSPSYIGGGNLTLGVTYKIEDAGGYGWDFTNVGAPNNNIDTRFIATGEIPTSWGTDGELSYISAAPKFVILEDTIGGLTGWYFQNGYYYLLSDEGLFTENKTWVTIDSSISRVYPYPPTNIVPVVIDLVNQGLPYYVSIKLPISNLDNLDYTGDDVLNNTPIEIRVYN